MDYYIETKIVLSYFDSLNLCIFIESKWHFRQFVEGLQNQRGLTVEFVFGFYLSVPQYRPEKLTYELQI